MASIRTLAETAPYRESLEPPSQQIKQQLARALQGQAVTEADLPEVYRRLRAEGLTGRADKLFLAASAREQTSLLFLSHGRDLAWALRQRPDLDSAYIELALTRLAPGSSVALDDLEVAAGVCPASDDSVDQIISLLGDEGNASVHQQLVRILSRVLRNNANPVGQLNNRWVKLQNIPGGWWIAARYRPELQHQRNVIGRILAAVTNRDLAGYLGQFF